MTELRDIPSWMEETLLKLTGGIYASIDDLKKDAEILIEKGDDMPIMLLNNTIDVLTALKHFSLLV
jgi:hypothetical protein